MKTCEGCRMLMQKDPLKRGDCWTLHCTDPDKPIHGKFRTIAAAGSVLRSRRRARPGAGEKRKPPAGLAPRRTAKARRNNDVC